MCFLDRMKLKQELKKKTFANISIKIYELFLKNWNNRKPKFQQLKVKLLILTCSVYWIYVNFYIKKLIKYFVTTTDILDSLIYPTTIYLLPLLCYHQSCS